jgi:hypothetical protein
MIPERVCCNRKLNVPEPTLKAGVFLSGQTNGKTHFQFGGPHKAGPGTRMIVKPRLGSSILIALLAGPAGCANEATLVRDTPEGGLVSYAYQTEGQVLATAGRRDAFELIAERCPNGSRIIREGEIPRVSRTADRVWRGQLGMDRLWGIQFECQ